MQHRVPVQQKPLKFAVWWSVITILTFLAVEAAIFRSGWYGQYLQPNSSTGRVENSLYWLRHTPVAPQGEVAVIGDSRVAEGFSTLRADAAGGNRLVFRSLGISGSSIRTLYYLLRDADPDRHRFRAVVIGLERYRDDDSFDDAPDRIRDLSYSLGRLRLSDCWAFAMSMKSPDWRHTALSGCLFKGLVLRADFHEFLLDPAARIKTAQAWREHGLDWVNAYTGIDRKMIGISADFKRGVVTFPPGMEPALMATVRETVMPNVPPDTGEYTRYRQLWLGRILDLYRDSPTRIIFIEMPRAPVPIPETRVPPRFIRSMAGRPGVFVLPADTFREFERPELFADGLHLNNVGRNLFSAKLAREVLAALRTE